jgi:hypothetical protein
LCFRPQNHTQQNRRIDGQPPQREGGLVSGSQSGNVNGRVEENRLHLLALEELYAGIAPRGRHVLERFKRDFEKARRILVPNLNDWTETGKVLARLANKYDYDPDILSELAETVRKTLSHERHVHLVPENDNNAAHCLSSEPRKPPRLYNAQWNDDY